MAIDLFDTVEMIDFVLEENEHDFGIPNGFGAFMIVLASVSLALSTWRLRQNNLYRGETKIRPGNAIWCNLPFLIILAVVSRMCGEHSHDQ